MMMSEHITQRASLVFEPAEYGQAYFELEDRILSDPRHPGHIMPALAPGESVLNLGCGSMKRLSSDGELYVGVDPFFEAFKECRRADSGDFRIQAIAEALPIRDGTFRLIMSRVAIMYMDVPKFIPEVHRVLASDGRVWFTGHKFTHVVLHLMTSLRALNAKDVIFRLYVISNGLLFHYTGLMIRFPLNRSRIESFQTKGGLRRALARQGFTNIEFPVDAPSHRGLRRGARRLRRLMRSRRLRQAAIQLLEWRNFLVTARKPPDSDRFASATAGG